MTANPSLHRALRLPRDFAFIAVGLDALMFLINMSVLLLPSTPEAGHMREAYTLPSVWVTLFAGMAMSWLLAAALSWSHGRHALERHGAARVALARDARLRFGGVWVLAMVLNYYALTPLFYEIQVMFMPGGRLQDVFAYSPRIYMGVAMTLQSLVQMVVLVLGLWLAARIALAKSRVAGSAAQEEGEAGEPVPGSPRRAVALLVGAFFAALQLWSGLALARWAPPSSDLNVGMLLLTWVLPAGVTFALAAWGGWLGTRPGLLLARPFRAVAAAVSAFLLVQVSCIVVALAWLFVAATTSFSFYSGGGIVGFVLAVVLLYTAMAVVLARAATRMLYRRYL